MRARLQRLLSEARKGVLDLIFPPHCMSCRTAVSDVGGLCSDCWCRIEFLDGPLCACCGRPFEFDPRTPVFCAACHARPPAFDKARAIMRYDEHSRGPILALKHADRLDLALAFGRWLARSGHELVMDCDIILPVPLHPMRLWTRRYNQAAELARALSRKTGKPADFSILLRNRHTPSQGAMPSARARQRNMRGAFRISPSHKTAIAGRHVLLVDDVLTTGATVEACARVLKRSGAAKVFVLALARVVRPAAGNVI